MANISNYLAQILAAVYGEEVRGSIHDAIEAINNEVITNTNTANAAATSAGASQVAAEAAQAAAEAAQSSASSSETVSVAAQTAAEAAQAAAEGAQTQANTYAAQAQASQNAAEASRIAAANSAASAEASAMRASEIVLGNIKGDSIPMSSSDSTSIANTIISLASSLQAAVDSVKPVYIDFSDLTFTESGGDYYAIVEREDILATMKPDHLWLLFPSAQASDLEVTTYDGYAQLMMTAPPPEGTIFSGTIKLVPQ